MKNKLKMSIAIGLLTSVGAIAQDGPPPMGMPGGPMGAGHFGGGGGHKLVTGVPYSADASSQSLQTLADGNTISRTTTSHVARDSQGRTYTQETIAGGFMGASGPVTIVFISDPVAGFMYRLNASTKVATRTALRVPPASPNGGAQPGGPRGFGAGRDGGNAQTADLGTQVIGGVSAQGKSVTHTVPAGAMGNAQPIVSSGEVWYSPDLQIVVQAKHSDPRMGQSTYALTNIQRAEPTPSLFQVPSDYTVQDGKSGLDHGPFRQ